MRVGPRGILRSSDISIGGYCVQISLHYPLLLEKQGEIPAGYSVRYKNATKIGRV
jgi:hypothetical protein